LAAPPFSGVTNNAAESILTELARLDSIQTTAGLPDCEPIPGAAEFSDLEHSPISIDLQLSVGDDLEKEVRAPLGLCYETLVENLWGGI
jgi:hypothetical protein